MAKKKTQVTSTEKVQEPSCCKNCAYSKMWDEMNIVCKAPLPPMIETSNRPTSRLAPNSYVCGLYKHNGE